MSPPQPWLQSTGTANDKYPGFQTQVQQTTSTLAFKIQVQLTTNTLASETPGFNVVVQEVTSTKCRVTAQRCCLGYAMCRPGQCDQPLENCTASWLSTVLLMCLHQVALCSRPQLKCAQQDLLHPDSGRL